MSRKAFHSLSSVLAGSSSLGLDRLAPLTGVDLANVRLALSASSQKLPVGSPSSEPPLSPSATRHAAVLLGLCNMDERGPGLILTVRSLNMRTHPGEISFPGGHQDPGTDQSLLGTALREAHEEIGLIPSQLEYLGSLEPLVSNSGPTLVWPFVVFVHSLEPASKSARVVGSTPMIPRPMSKLTLEPLRSPGLDDLHGKHQLAEVELVFQISLTALLEPDRQRSSYFRNDPGRPYIEWNVQPEISSVRNTTRMQLPEHSSNSSYKLWGLTGWLVHSFLQRIRLL
ncbi:hypothetical protein PCANC_06706 [Puccinia coronata f. sp. avenae]|uniref:Nudix hydrolase domain-containing protein n=1 Tax=Puccinia coronata f. sp. avenae TaxID=200324 RepID=A0A2N5VUC1_9BASI|nr:hypothetical protein PCANC_06706 [Puccinia coronata f. sp. avenae]